MGILEQINHRSRLLLKGVQDKCKNAHLNSTACSIGSVGNDTGVAEEDLSDIEQLVASLRSEIDAKRREFEQKARRQEKSKVEDQMLFRKMLYEYEGRLTHIKGEIKLREECIQEMERLQKEGKVPAVEQKILGVFYSSFELFDDMCFCREQLEETVARTDRLEQEIRMAKEEIRRLQQVTFKLRVAKQAKMPYHKFRSVMRHGAISMESEDREDYAALVELSKDDEELVRPTRSRIAGESTATPEMLYLMIRKEEINKEMLGKLIREEDKRQEELLAQNQLLKQAILAKEQEQFFQEAEANLRQERRRRSREENHERLS